MHDGYVVALDEDALGLVLDRPGGARPRGRSGPPRLRRRACPPAVGRHRARRPAGARRDDALPRSSMRYAGGLTSIRTSPGYRAAPTTRRWPPAAGSTPGGWTTPSRTGPWCCRPATTTAHGSTARRCAAPGSTRARRTRRRGRSCAGGTAARSARWSSGPRWTWCCGTRRRRTAAERRDGLARATRLLAAAGITWVQEAALAPADVQVYLDNAAEGRLPLRANIALRAEPDRWRQQRGEFLAARHAAATSRVAHEVGVRTVKIFADGIVEAGTAAMLAPYESTLGGAARHSAARSGRRTSSPRRRRPSTPTGSSCTCTPSGTRRCA